MAWLSESLDLLRSWPAPVMLSGAAVFALAESGLGVGMLVPGETVVLVLGAALGESPLIVALFVVVALAGSAGDHIGYALGRRYGTRLRETRVVRRLGQENWDRANHALRRHGARAVFLTRLIPVVRTLTPAAAGVAAVPYRRFLPASLTGAFLWSATFTFTGAAAGASIEHVETVIARTGWVLAGLVGVGVLIGVGRAKNLRCRCARGPAERRRPR